MAGKKVEVDLALRDKGNSIKERTKEAKALNKELEKTQKLASGTKTGTQAAAMTDRSYGQARGAMGATGASGRDFANQAQGLGGLVRLYATYAANVFAVGAAFRALSEASRVDSMVAAMDKLGAKSGVALGTVAKQFMDATDGAISFQEAMRSVTKATSAGMSSKELMQLAKVAKGASLALGVDMEDAISRLTRGVTKLEPELLDELGIYTKIGPATKAYAKELGKSATELTEAERRQAFLNATLTEGISKYGELADSVANPYDQLSASLKNLAQEGLSLVNKVLVPIVELFSSNSTLLTGALAALGVGVVKQALPAIGEYRQALDDAAEESANKAEALSTKSRDIQLKHLKELEAQYEDDAEKKIKNLYKVQAEVSKSLRSTSVAYKLLTDETREYTKADVASLEKQARRYETLGRTDIAEVYKRGSVAVREHIAAQNDLKTATQRANQEASRGYTVWEKYFTARGRASQAAERAQQIAMSRGLIREAGSNTEAAGMGYAFGELNKNIKSSGIGGIRALFTRAAGGVTILTTAFTGLVSALSGIIFVVTTVVAVLSGLYNFMSSNRKEAGEFSSSIEDLDSSFKTLNNTYSHFNDSTAPEAIQAKARAFQEMTVSVKSFADSFKAVDENANALDRHIDGWKILIGGGLKVETAEEFGKAAVNAMQKIEDPKLQQEYRSRIAEYMPKAYSFSDAEYMAEAAAKLDNDQFRSLIDAFPIILASIAKKVSEGAKEVVIAAEKIENANAHLQKLNEMRTQGALRRTQSVAQARRDLYANSDAFMSLSPASQASESGRLKEVTLRENSAKTMLDLLNKQKMAEAEILDIQAKDDKTAKDQQRLEILRETVTQATLDKYTEAEMLEILVKQNSVLTKRAVEKAKEAEATKLIKETQEKSQLALQSQQLTQQIISDATNRRLGYEQEVLQYQINSGMLTADQAQAAQAALDKRVLAQELAVNLDSEEIRHKTKLLELETKIALAKAGKADPQIIENLKEEVRQENLRNDSNRQSLKSQADLGQRVIDMNNEMSVSQKALRDRFVQGFEDMGDAIVDFVMTGKASFGDLIKSMIADMIKLQMRQNMAQVGNFAMNAIMAAFSGSPESRALMAGTQPLAKGGAFDAGVKAFAKGGMFTNSIVNQPTMFKFAQGVGLMGEAGPEAIMPLKRDSSGNLGVRSNGNSTQVTIINNTGQPVQQEETQDSKGNRKLEIVVGETAAGQVKTNGSQMQNSMRSTYGLQPALIRR